MSRRAIFEGQVEWFPGKRIESGQRIRSLFLLTFSRFLAVKPRFASSQNCILVQKEKTRKKQSKSKSNAEPTQK
jgi:hypothetical protein